MPVIDDTLNPKTSGGSGGGGAVGGGASAKGARRAGATSAQRRQAALSHRDAVLGLAAIEVSPILLWSFVFSDAQNAGASSAGRRQAVHCTDVQRCFFQRFLLNQLTILNLWFNVFL